MTQQANGKSEPTASDRTVELFNDLRENYLKEFIRKNRVTPAEYRQAILFLQRTGDAGEIPLMADVFLETTVDEVAYGGWEGSATTIEGPYYIEGAPEMESPCELPRREDEPGDALFFSGTVRDKDGNPLPGALLDVWHADANGLYSNIDPSVPEYNLRGKVYADEQGRFEIRTVVPAPYEIPKEGPTGQLLRAIGSHTWRPAHIHLMVGHEGYQRITTQIFFEGGEWVNDDCVDAVKDDLVVRLELHDDPADYRERGLDEPYYTMEYDFVMVPEREKAAN